jgi:serine/threonine-protein kinase
VRSDIYSLGVTLYHIIVGELPFAGSDDSDVMRRQILEGLSASRLKGKDVSPHMHYFLEKMMAKERDVRYQSPRELVEDIREHIRGKKTLTFNPRYASDAAAVDVEKPYVEDAPSDDAAKKSRESGSRSAFFRFRRGRGPT